MNKPFERNRKNRRNDFEEDFYYSDGLDFRKNEKKGRRKRDIGKRYHRKRTLKDDFWDDDYKYN